MPHSPPASVKDPDSALRDYDLQGRCRTSNQATAVSLLLIHLGRGEKPPQLAHGQIFAAPNLKLPAIGPRNQDPKELDRLTFDQLQSGAYPPIERTPPA